MGFFPQFWEGGVATDADTEREVVVAGGRGWPDWVKRAKGLRSTAWQPRNSHREAGKAQEAQSVPFGDYVRGQVGGDIGGTPCEAYDGPTARLSTRNQHKIKLKGKLCVV